MKKKLLTLLLAATMTLSMAACGNNNNESAGNSTPGTESQTPGTESQASGTESQTPSADSSNNEGAAVEDTTQLMVEVNKQENIDVNAHDTVSEEIYNTVFGEYQDRYDEALAETNVSLRLAKMAIAEAKMLEAGAVTPYVNDAGNYAISATLPHTVPAVEWGFDGEVRAYSNVLIADRLLTPEERTELTTKWSELKGTGTWIDFAKQWAADNGITLADSYSFASNSNYEPTTWDYLSSSKTADGQTLSATWDGLLRYDSENLQQPALAESYEISEDGLTYTFHLRKGVKWVTYQGTEYAELKADDFVAAMQHIGDTPDGGLYAVVSCIENLADYASGEITDFSEVGVKALDDYTVQYTLSEPTPWFLSVVGYSAMAPLCRSYYESQGGKFGEEFDASAADYTFGSDAQHIVYCGAYLVSNYTAQNTIVLTANPSYYDADNVQIKTVTLKYNDGTDELFTWNNFFNGTFNGGVGLNSSALEQAKATVVPDDPDGKNYFEKYAYVVSESATSFLNFVNLNRYAYANFNDETQVMSGKTQLQAERSHAAMMNQNFRLALALANDRGTVNALSRGEDLRYARLTNSYVPGNFISTSEEITIDINGTATTYPIGTFYGEILQDQITADGYPMKVWDPSGADGAGSSLGFDGWYLPEEAVKYLDKAIEELAAEGIEISESNPIYLDMLYEDYSTTGSAMNQAQKQGLETVLGGKVIINLVPTVSSENESYAAYYGTYGYQMNYDYGGNTGWGPDYGDAQTYLDTLVAGGYMGYALGLW